MKEAVYKNIDKRILILNFFLLISIKDKHKKNAAGGCHSCQILISKTVLLETTVD